MARKTKYSAALSQEICDEIRNGSSQEDAARIAGITSSTFYEWMNSKPEFSEDVEKAHSDFKKANVIAIRAAGVRKDKSGDLKGQWQANAWLLERKYPDEFGQKLTIKLTPEQAATLKEAGTSASELVENFVQKYHKAKQEVSNGS